MIQNVIAWAIRRRELVALGAIFVLVAGLWLLRTMPVDAIPDLSDTQVIVYSDYPGQAPQVVESRVLEYLNAIQSRLPAAVKTRLGPDATGVGWVYQYALEGPGYAPDRLRSIQDFQVRYALQSVPGVAEVASLGGYVRQYQVLLDPARLLASGGARCASAMSPA